MRRLVALGLVLALAGGGAALAARGDPQKRLTPADQARAKAMLVRPADLPAFQSQPAGPTGDFYCAALDESDLTLTGEARARRYTLGTVTVTSTAAVYESLADASASWRRATGAAGVRCARAVLAREFAAGGIKLVSLRRIPFPRLAQKTIVFRAVLAGPGTQPDLRVYVDLVALLRARAVTTIVYGSALVLPPRSEELRLGRLVAARMAKAMRGG